MNTIVNELPRNKFNPRDALPTLSKQAKLTAPSKLREFQNESDALDKAKLPSVDQDWSEYQKSITEKMRAGQALPVPMLSRNDFELDWRRRDEALFEERKKAFRRHWPITKKILLDFVSFCERTAENAQKQMDEDLKKYGLPSAESPLAVVISTLARSYRQTIEAYDKNDYQTGSPRSVLTGICEI